MKASTYLGIMIGLALLGYMVGKLRLQVDNLSNSVNALSAQVRP